jgi:probable phosphoglycerate mutase
MKIGLIRHGRTAWNEAGKLQGRTDIPLSDHERERLSSLTLPDEWRDADVLSSTLGRARETAEIISQHAVETNSALIEMNLGTWEGRQGAMLIDDPASGYRHVEEWGWDMRPPSGETPEEVRARVMPVVESLRRDTVIVSHINIMRVILAVVHGWDFRGEMPFRIKRDRLTVIERVGDEWRPSGEPVRLVPRCA